MLNNSQIMLNFCQIMPSIKNKIKKKFGIMLNTSQIMLDFAKLCLA